MRKDHLSDPNDKTTVYPDKATSADALRQFHERIGAMAMELGLHNYFAVAEVASEAGDMQSASAHGCVGCMANTIRSGITKTMDANEPFRRAMIAASVVGFLANLREQAEMAEAQKRAGQA